MSRAMIDQDADVAHAIDALTEAADAGRFTRAGAGYKKALAACVRAFGAESFDTANVALGLSHVLFAASDFAGTTEKIHGGRLVAVATLLHNLGGLEHARGVPLARESLRIRRALRGRSTPRPPPTRPPSRASSRDEEARGGRAPVPSRPRSSWRPSARSTTTWPSR